MYWDILNAWHATEYGILVQGLNWIAEQYTFGTEMGNKPKKYIDLSLYSPLPRSSPQKLSEISWFVCLDITSLFVTSTANDSNAQICLHSNIHKWTKPNEQSHNRRPKRPFRMDYAKMAIFILLAFSCLHNTDGRCTPQDCQVSSWTYWSSCYGERCGGRGVQRRTRWQDIVPSCGGSECPILEETRSCGSELTRRDCQLSSWSHWSTCSTPCGVSGVESSSRYKIITEQCGGYCPSILRKTRVCSELSCLNGGRLNHDGTCSCAEGYSGQCCEVEPNGKWFTQ